LPQYELPPCQRYAFKTGRWSSHQQLVRRIRRFAAGRSLRILDIGCGSRSLADVLRRAGHYVVGVDAASSPDEEEAFDDFFARDLDGGLGDVGDVPFDAVLLSDVLEHLSAPEKLLLDARERLADGGRVFASSGNVANWYIRFQLLLGRFEYTERGILDRTHCRLFTRGSFRKLHRECGFRVLHDGTTPIPFEFVFGAGLLARACDAVNAGAAKIWPGLFAYQVMLEAEVDQDHPAPLVQHDQIHRRFDPYRVQPMGDRRYRRGAAAGRRADQEGIDMSSSTDAFDFFDVRSLLSDEERQVQQTVGRFVDEKVLPVVAKAFEDHRFPIEMAPQIAGLGLLGCNLQGYDCAGLNNVCYGLACQELERGDSGVRSFVSVQGSLCMFPIYTYGSEAQKQRWLPRMARGEVIGCFGLTEPDGGSDPAR
jgi:SAM-dependent methyltransferase